MIPEDYEEGTNPGKYLTYQWDKYSKNEAGECAYDYSAINLLGGEVRDIRSSDGFCGINFKLVAFDCGYGCPAEHRTFVIYTFEAAEALEGRERRVYWDNWFR